MWTKIKLIFCKENKFFKQSTIDIREIVQGEYLQNH